MQMGIEEKLTEGDLQMFTGTEHYYKHPFGLLYTDGIAFMAEKGKCYWLIDTIGSYQREKRVKKMSIQFWRLRKNPDRSALLELCYDIPGEVILKQHIQYTTFPLKQIILYLANNVLHLPSEY